MANFLLSLLFIFSSQNVFSAETIPLRLESFEGFTQQLDLRSDTQLDGSYKKMAGPSWFSLEETGEVVIPDTAPVGSYPISVSVETPEQTESLSLQLEVIGMSQALKLSATRDATSEYEISDLSGIEGKVSFEGAHPEWVRLKDDTTLEATPTWGGKYPFVLRIRSESENVRVPVSFDVDFPKGLKALSVGRAGGLLLKDGKLEPWGPTSNIGFSFPEVIKLVQVSVGGSHACALTQDAVRCWGSTQESAIPVLHHPRQVSSGESVSCALDKEGVKCWPNRTSATGTASYHSTLHMSTATLPLRVPDLENPKSVDVSTRHACAADDVGVRCWGAIETGMRYKKVEGVKKVGTGLYNTCGLFEDKVECWEHKTTYRRYVPTLAPSTGAVPSTDIDEIPELDKPTELVVGDDHACAIDKEGVKCWGSNRQGELEKPELVNPTQLAVHGRYTCALDEEGVKCWGLQPHGWSVPPPLFN